MELKDEVATHLFGYLKSKSKSFDVLWALFLIQKSITEDAHFISLVQGFQKPPALCDEMVALSRGKGFCFLQKYVIFNMQELEAG